ncbi:oxidoreductase [Apiospora marii]|uniref:Oxidoreductase n=1 Tax=Apiospora marii TaxID=335849 RepID=A0ABR1R154_9PEZI
MAVKTTQTALVTGCSEGALGFAIAQAFQARGAHVFATARSPAKAAALAGLPNVTVLALDVTSDTSIREALRVVTEHTGGRGELDYLVNNAGSQYVMSTLDLDIEVAKWMYEVNVWGVVAVIKAFAPLVVKAKGTIANLASISGLVRSPYMGVYAGSKSACEAISEALRLEPRPFGVQVLTVIVGAVKSNIFANGPGYELPAGSHSGQRRRRAAREARGLRQKPRWRHDGRRDRYRRARQHVGLGSVRYCGVSAVTSRESASNTS